MRRLIVLTFLLALPTWTHADISSDDAVAARAWIETFFESTPGQDFGGQTIQAEAQGITVTADLIGVGFCMPADPFVAPSSNPTPPNNAWGCENDVTVTSARVEQDLAITVTAAIIFIDVQSTRPELFLCGECFSSTATVMSSNPDTWWRMVPS